MDFFEDNYRWMMDLLCKHYEKGLGDERYTHGVISTLDAHIWRLSFLGIIKYDIYDAIHKELISMLPFK